MRGAAAAGSTRGRPRSATAERAILTATLRLLGEQGYDGLTTDRLAARAGVSKATIYRRWASKDEVVLAAVELLADEVPRPDTGSLRGDLVALAEGLAAVFGGPDTARLVSAVLDRAAHDPDLATALRGGFLRARRDTARDVMVRARERGEIHPDADLDLAVDLLAAPFYYRVLVTGDPVDGRFAGRVVDATLAWLASPAARAPG